MHSSNQPSTEPIKPYGVFFDRQQRAAIVARVMGNALSTYRAVGETTTLHMTARLEDEMRALNLRQSRGYYLSFNAEGWQRAESFHIKACVTDDFDLYLDAWRHATSPPRSKERVEKWMNEVKRRAKESRSPLLDWERMKRALVFYEDNYLTMNFAVDEPIFLVEPKQSIQVRMNLIQHHS